MKKQFAVLLSLTLPAAVAVSFASADVATKGMKSEKKKTTAAGQKTSGGVAAKSKVKGQETVTPADKNQKGGKKGGEKANTPAKSK